MPDCGVGFLWMLKLLVDPSGGGNTCANPPLQSSISPAVLYVDALNHLIPQEMQTTHLVVWKKGNKFNPMT